MQIWWRRVLRWVSVEVDWTNTDFALRRRVVTLLRIVVNCRQLLSDLCFRYIRYFYVSPWSSLAAPLLSRAGMGQGSCWKGVWWEAWEQCIVVSCRTVFLQFVHSSVTSLESGVLRGGSRIRSASARLWRKESTLCGSHLHRAARLTDPIGCGWGGLFMWTLIERWSDPPTGAALVTEMVEQSVATMSIHEYGVPRSR